MNADRLPNGTREPIPCLSLSFLIKPLPLRTASGHFYHTNDDTEDGHAWEPTTWSAVGLVSRVTPVHTAMRNCTRDEGRPFEFGNQVLISSHRKLLWSKATVVNVAEEFGGTRFRQV